MNLTHDYIQRSPHSGTCRIRIFQEAGALPVVVCTEPEDNLGMNITNAAEVIAGEVIAKHPDVFKASPEAEGKPFVWIEHYENGARGTEDDPATFELVTFASYEVRDVMGGGRRSKAIGVPSWKSLDRATAEALAGAEL